MLQRTIFKVNYHQETLKMNKYLDVSSGVFVKVRTLIHIHNGHLLFSEWTGGQRKSFLFAKNYLELIRLMKTAVETGRYYNVPNKWQNKTNIRVICHYDRPIGITADGFLCHLISLVINPSDMAILTILPTMCCDHYCKYQHSSQLPAQPCYALHTDKSCDDCGMKQLKTKFDKPVGFILHKTEAHRIGQLPVMTETPPKILFDGQTCADCQKNKRSNNLVICSTCFDVRRAELFSRDKKLMSKIKQNDRKRKFQ
jgi:hypothetical protein